MAIIEEHYHSNHPQQMDLEELIKKVSKHNKPKQPHKRKRQKH